MSEDTPTTTPRPEREPTTGPERQCVACRRRDKANRLLRLAAGPHGAVVVDVYRRMPGRGAHVCAAPECVRQAMEKGGVSRGLKEPVGGNAQEMCLAAAAALEEKAIQVLSIGRRSGATQLGMDVVLRTLAAQRAAVVVAAVDVSSRSREEVAAPARLQGVPVLDGPPMEVLGAVLGRGDVGLVAVQAGPLAQDVIWLFGAAAKLRVPLKERAKKQAAPVETGEGGA